MPGTLRDTNYPEEKRNIVLGMTNRWVAAVLYALYQAAVYPKSASAYSFEDNGDTIAVRSRENEFLLVKDDLKCDYEFAVSMQLPYRHTRRSLAVVSPSRSLRYLVGMYMDLPEYWQATTSYNMQILTTFPFVLVVYQVVWSKAFLDC
ncbi:hypothetical protein JG688_00017382 [Phytophthora aleatoria]|uniref:Uncharacterized protein n=1 Tax=Phytophthora aleatoria TaxID=2496075 RepID=A0A8J5LVD5_9STRA|nr:hypothetical protein JG688_00017382 [Phytophthora aleatoria]